MTIIHKLTFYKYTKMIVLKKCENKMEKFHDEIKFLVQIKMNRTALDKKM